MNSDQTESTDQPAGTPAEKLAEKSTEHSLEEAAVEPAKPSLRERVIAELKTIEDPEVFLDIWFLGLIYDLEILPEERLVKIDMTFTTPLCPFGPELVKQVNDKVSALPEFDEVRVKVVFSPPWAPSDEVKALMGLI